AAAQLAAAGRRQLRGQVADEVLAQRALPFRQGIQTLDEVRDLVLAVRTANERRQRGQQLAAMSGYTETLILHEEPEDCAGSAVDRGEDRQPEPGVPPVAAGQLGQRPAGHFARGRS